MFQYPKFIRNVRQQYQVPDTAIEVLALQTETAGAQEESADDHCAGDCVLLALIVILRGIMGAAAVPLSSTVRL